MLYETHFKNRSLFDCTWVLAWSKSCCIQGRSYSWVVFHLLFRIIYITILYWLFLLNSTPSILLHLHYSKIYITHKENKAWLHKYKKITTTTLLPQRTPFYPLHYSCSFVFYGYATNASTIHSVHIIPIAVVI